MDLLSVAATLAWFLALLSVLEALRRARRQRCPEGWLLASWGFLCVSLVCGHF